MQTKFALSAAALLRLAAGQIVHGDGADDISTEDWESVQEAADWTQTRSFTGRDISSAYPGESQDGWELRVAFKDDLEAGDEERTAGSIALLPPNGQEASDMDDSWHLCMHVLPVQAVAVGGFGEEIDADCTSIVAPECVDDIKKRARSNYDEECSTWKITPSCLRDMEEVRGQSVAIGSDDAESLLGNSTSFYRYSAGTHPADEEEPSVGVAAASVPRLVVTVFGSLDAGEDEEPFVEVQCMLPDTVEEDSFDPLAEEEGAASNVATLASWAALTAGAAFYLL